MRDPNNLIIINMPRCGSNLLQAAMHLTSRFHGIERLYLDEYFLSHNEYYVDWQNKPLLLYVDKPLRKYFDSQEEWLDFYHADIVRKIDLYKKYRLQPLTAKMVYNHGFAFVMNELNQLGEKFVVLYRKDVAAQIISYVLAEKTDMWNLVNSSLDRYAAAYQAAEPCLIPPERIYDFLQSMQAFDAAVKDSIVVARYAYEDVIADLPSIVEELTGMKYPADAIQDGLPQCTSKLYDPKVKIRNYDSIISLFANHDLEELKAQPLPKIRELLGHG